MDRLLERCYCQIFRHVVEYTLVDPVAVFALRLTSRSLDSAVDQALLDGIDRSILNKDSQCIDSSMLKKTSQCSQEHVHPLSPGGIDFQFSVSPISTPQQVILPNCTNALSASDGAALQSLLGAMDDDGIVTLGRLVIGPDARPSLATAFAKRAGSAAAFETLLASAKARLAKMSSLSHGNEVQNAFTNVETLATVVKNHPTFNVEVARQSRLYPVAPPPTPKTIQEYAAFALRQLKMALSSISEPILALLHRYYLGDAKGKNNVNIPIYLLVECLCTILRGAIEERTRASTILPQVTPCHTAKGSKGVAASCYGFHGRSTAAVLKFFTSLLLSTNDDDIVRATLSEEFLKVLQLFVLTVHRPTDGDVAVVCDRTLPWGR